MKYKLKIIAIIFLISLSITGCYNILLPIRIPTRQPEIPQNLIKKDIPKYPDNKVFTYYKYAKQKQKQLNLSAPEDGYDSLLLRIWFTYPESLHQYAELLEININSNNIKSAKYTRMRIFFNQSRDCEVINSHIDSLVNEPNKGWENFMQMLNTYEITKLPTIESLKIYKSFNRNRGGIDYKNTRLTVSVEVATKNEYKFIQYNGFEFYKVIDEVNNMYSFIKYLRNDFHMVEIDPKWYKN